jgi:hypothetical protein
MYPQVWLGLAIPFFSIFQDLSPISQIFFQKRDNRFLKDIDFLLMLKILSRWHEIGKIIRCYLFPNLFQTIAMKLKNTLKCILLFYILFAALLVSGQTVLPLNKFVLVSGRENQPGAVYRFASVKTGIDALVSIDKLSKSASLNGLDFSQLGFAAALQPELSIAPHSWGEVQFSIKYVLAGTNMPATLADLPAKRKKYACKEENCGDLKLYISKQSANSIRVILYMANFYSRILTRKAEFFLQKSDYEKNIPAEIASINLTQQDRGN